MKKHILVISQYFYPEQFRINDICSEWVNKGYEVTVITGIPNYPEGKFYKGYGFFKKRKDTYNGVNIIRIPLIPRGNNSIFLAFNYVSFVISGYFWSLLTKVKADYVFIFEVSPMTQALPGVWYSKKRRIPCYIYVQDLWPENVEIITGIKNKIIIGAVEKMVDYIYANSDKIFTTSESFVEVIINRKVDKGKVKYLPQYAEDFYHPVKRDFTSGIKNNGKLNVVFTGNIGFAQGLDLLPKVARKLIEYGYGEKVCFNLVGNGRYREELESHINSLGLEHMFEFYGQKPPEKIPQFMADSDVAYLSFTNNELFNMTIPAKLQSYMACGIPIIASAGGETKRIINESGSGYCTDTGDVEQLVKSIIKYSKLSPTKRNSFRKNALRYYNNNFNKTTWFNKLERYFQET